MQQVQVPFPVFVIVPLSLRHVTLLHVQTRHALVETKLNPSVPRKQRKFLVLYFVPYCAIYRLVLNFNVMDALWVFVEVICTFLNKKFLMSSLNQAVRSLKVFHIIHPAELSLYSSQSCFHCRVPWTKSPSATRFVSSTTSKSRIPECLN